MKPIPTPATPIVEILVKSHFSGFESSSSRHRAVVVPVSVSGGIDRTRAEAPHGLDGLGRRGTSEIRFKIH